MLIEPRLDDLTYQALFERARAMIPTLTSEWNDFNDHDPGITTLQTFAWLCDNLNYYMSTTGEQHRLKLLSLLGIFPRRSASSCRVSFTPAAGGETLPVGTRLAAGEIPFELTETVTTVENTLIKLYSEIGGELIELTELAGFEGGFVPILSESPETGASAWLGFSDKLLGEIRLFIEVDGGERNAMPEGFSLLELSWASRGAGGWQEITVLRDETRGLLQSGFITLSLSSETVAVAAESGMAPAHYLRCTANEGYDKKPLIGRVKLGCGVAAQTDTLIQALELDYDGGAIVPLDYAVDGEAEIAAYCMDGDGSYRSCEFTVERSGKLSVALKFSGSTKPEKGSRLLVTIKRGGVDKPLTLGITDGCANQMLEIDFPDALELRLALVREQDGRRILDIYEPCDNLSACRYDEKKFFHNPADSSITFGDSINGVQPPSGLAIEAVCLKLSYMDGGNVMSGRIDKFLHETQRPVSVISLEEASGGARALTSAELEPELAHKIQAVTRAVTPEDIRKIVMATPGLLIDDVAVVPMEEYSRLRREHMLADTIVVAVCPHSQKPRPALSETYSRVIHEHLEAYRLLGVQFKVVGVRYTGIGVYGRVLLREQTEQARQEVRDEIKRHVTRQRRFGARLDYGRLFSALEMLPVVKAVLNLSLACVDPGGEKNAHGDLILHPDCKAYLQEVGIEFQ